MELAALVAGSPSALSGSPRTALETTGEGWGRGRHPALRPSWGIWAIVSGAQCPESKCPPQPAPVLSARGVRGLRSLTTAISCCHHSPGPAQTRLPPSGPESWCECGGNPPLRAPHAGLSPGSTGCVTFDKLLNLSELCSPLPENRGDQSPCFLKWHTGDHMIRVGQTFQPLPAFGHGP